MDEKFLAKTGFPIRRKFYIQMEGLLRITMFRGFPLKCSVRGFAPDTPFGVIYKILRPSGSGFYKKLFQK